MRSRSLNTFTMAFDLKRNIVYTMGGKVTILLLNFLTVVITTRLWGAYGRGIIAVFMADISLIAIAANIFTGSSVSYYQGKEGGGRLFSIAFWWILLVSALGGLISRCMFDTPILQNLSVFFFVVSSLFGLLSFCNSVYIGQQKIEQYNLLTVLQPFLLLLFLLLFYHFVDPSFFSYFYALVLSLMIPTAVVLWGNRKEWTRDIMHPSWSVALQSFRFGFKTELSSFLQFFNYRLSLYFLSYYAGVVSGGVFSIGVTLSEAIWIVSRSISMVQYSRLLKEDDPIQAKRSSHQVALYSLFVTLGILIVVNMLPSICYEWVFGADFGKVKDILLVLSPGVLAIAVSNVYGHYFSAMGQLNILVIKSLIGVVVTVVLSILLIKEYQEIGASVVNMVANLVTSLVLIFFFIKKCKL